MHERLFNYLISLESTLGRIGRIVMRNALLTEGIEVVAVNE